MTNIPLIPFFIAVLLAAHGLRKKSLSPSGALGAFIVGFLMMSPRVKSFGVSLIVFYLVGSRATKVGKSIKAKLEDGHQEAGYRSAAQVFCNSASAFVASVIWAGLFTPGSTIGKLIPADLVSQGGNYDPDVLCPLSANLGNGWSRYLLLICLGHFACCLGDTLASELGILAKTPPILITTLKSVPPGTNGGVSLLGTIASLSGGIIMGLTMGVSLAVESSACRSSIVPLITQLVLIGASAGLFGSLLDSFMGATIQRTRYSTSKKLILQDESPATDDKEVKVISGFNLLTNNQVNLVSSIIIALVTAQLG